MNDPDYFITYSFSLNLFVLVLKNIVKEFNYTKSYATVEKTSTLFNFVLKATMSK